jgi:predicted transcriptional regulator
MNENLMSNEELQRQAEIICTCGYVGTCGPCLAENEWLRRARHELIHKGRPALLPPGCKCHLLTSMCDVCLHQQEEEMPKIKPAFPEGVLTKAQEDTLATKIYGSVKQLIHNDLGITREYIDQVITSTVDVQRRALESRYAKLPEDLSKAIAEKIGNLEPGSEPTDWFKAAVRKIIITEMNEAIKGAKHAGQAVSTFQEYIKKEIEAQVKKIVSERLKVDFKITLIDPREGELREIFGPEDSFRGVRES